MKLETIGFIVFLCLLIVAPTKNIHADVRRDDAGVDVSQRKISMSIKELVREVVRRNPDLLYARMQLAVSGHRIDFEKNIFEPEFFAAVNYHDTKSPNNTSESISRGGLETFNENQWLVNSGVGGLLPSGARWDLEYLQSRTNNSLIDEFRAYEHEYESQVKMTVRQPILKGFGSANTLFEYHNAVLDSDMQKQVYQKNAMDLIGLTVREYWKLYGARDLVKSLKKSVSLLDKSLDLLNERHKSGDVSEYEVLEARSSLISRQVELQSLENNVDTTQTMLFKLLNAYASSDNVILIPEYRDIESEWAEGQPFETFYEYAKENWPEFQIARKKHEKSIIHFKKMKNKALPDLDLIGSAWISNLDDNRLAGEAFETDFPSWEIGVEFTMPILFNKRQRSAVEMAKLNMRQTAAELENLEREVRTDLTTALQTLENSRSQLKAMQRNNELKQQLLLRDFERFSVGEISIDDLIEKEDDVTEYHRKWVNKLIENKLNQANFDKAVGTIIQKYLGDQDIFNLSIDQPEIVDTITEMTFK